MTDRRDTTPEAQANIRRFDIFAEWNRLQALERRRLPEPEARAYGIALAKIVAARKFFGHQPDQVREWKRQARKNEVHEDWWEHLGSSEEFEKKIVRRMGRDFYTHVFQPAVRRAWDEGRTYEEIRDALRAEWNRVG